MKIIGICCSPRRGQTTCKALEQCLLAARETDQNIETQLIELAGLDIKPCIACDQCKKEMKCSIDDDFNTLIPALADDEVAAMVIGTPVYFGSVTAQCKAFLDRCVLLARNGQKFRNRLLGALAVGKVRHGGHELAIQTIHAAGFCHDMICVNGGHHACHFGAALWSGPHANIEDDDLGIQDARELGKRMAQLIGSR
ncbi:MAG: flavodoxin family protein [Sedimentisphaerales bacterium]|nr:flavodoxin family protein [Sedimentisphaerales bacterium]